MTLPKISKISSNTFWYLFYTGIKTLTTLATVTVISRHLGPHAFGQFNFLLSIFLYSMVFDAFTHPQIVKKLYLSSSPPKGLMRSLYLITFALSVTAFICLSIAGYILVESALLPPLFILLAGILFKVFLPLSYIYDANLQSKVASFCLCISTVASQLMAIIFVLKDLPFTYLALAYASQPFLYSVSLFLFKNRIPTNQNLKELPNKKTSLLILKSSLPMFMAALLIQAITRIDAVMIEKLMSFKDYGYFAIATRLTDPLVLVSSAVCISVFPVLMKLFEGKNHNFGKQLFKYNLVLLAFAFTIAITVSFISTPLVTLIFGNEYETSARLLRIYIWCLPFLFIHNLQSVWEVIQSKQHVFVYRAFLACLANSIFNFILIPKMGTAGAAIATVASYFFLTFGSSLIIPTSRSFLATQLGLKTKEL